MDSSPTDVKGALSRYLSVTLKAITSRHINVNPKIMVWLFCQRLFCCIETIYYSLLFGMARIEMD